MDSATLLLQIESGTSNQPKFCSCVGKDALQVSPGSDWDVVGEGYGIGAEFVLMENQLDRVAWLVIFEAIAQLLGCYRNRQSLATHLQHQFRKRRQAYPPPRT